MRTFLVWLAVGLLSRLAGAEEVKLSRDELDAFTWFSQLDVISSRGLPPLEVWTGGSSHGADGPSTATAMTKPGFLLKQDGKNFTVLGLWLLTEDYIESPATAVPFPVHHEPRRLDDFAEAFLASGGYWGGYEFNSPTAPPKTKAFLLAWHCWTQGRNDLAARVLGSLNQMPLGVGRENPKPRETLRATMSPLLAEYLFQTILASFANPRLSRPALLAKLRLFQQQFPESPEVPSARQLAGHLASLVSDEEANPLLSEEALVRLPPAAQARERIRLLRDEGLPFSGPDGENSRKLQELGEAAVPALIEALDDNRPSRYTDFASHWTNSMHGRLRSIGEQAGSVLGSVFPTTLKKFGYVDVFAPTPDLPSPRRLEAREIWAEYQSKGRRQYLIEAVAKGESDMYGQARSLATEYPDDAGEAVLKGYGHLEWNHKSSVLELLDKIKHPGCLALLQTELEKGENFYVKSAAAVSLRNLGHGEATLAMAREWRQLRVFADLDGSENIISFLASADDPHVVQQLTENFSERPYRIKEAVLSALAGAYTKASGRTGPTSPRIQSLIEETLAASLPNEEELWTGSGGGYRNPSLGDQAARSLSSLLPERYRFNPSAPFADRQQARHECLNAWKKSRGLPETAYVSPPELEPLRSNEITAVSFQDEGLKGTETRRQLEALTGKKLNPDDVISLISGFAAHLPAGVNGLHLRMVRTARPTGVSIAVWTHPGPAPREGDSFSSFTEVTRAGESLCDRGATIATEYAGKPEMWNHGKEALEKAVALPPDSELLVRFSLQTHQE